MLIVNQKTKGNNYGKKPIGKITIKKQVASRITDVIFYLNKIHGRLVNHYNFRIPIHSKFAI